MPLEGFPFDVLNQTAMRNMKREPAAREIPDELAAAIEEVRLVDARAADLLTRAALFETHRRWLWDEIRALKTGPPPPIRVLRRPLISEALFTLLCLSHARSRSRMTPDERGVQIIATLRARGGDAAKAADILEPAASGRRSVHEALCDLEDAFPDATEPIA